jgi:hypothetical protein
VRVGGLTILLFCAVFWAVSAAPPRLRSQRRLRARERAILAAAREWNDARIRLIAMQCLEANGMPDGPNMVHSAARQLVRAEDALGLAVSQLEAA